MALIVSYHTDLGGSAYHVYSFSSMNFQLLLLRGSCVLHSPVRRFWRDARVDQDGFSLEFVQFENASSCGVTCIFHCMHFVVIFILVLPVHCYVISLCILSTFPSSVEKITGMLLVWVFNFSICSSSCFFLLCLYSTVLVFTLSPFGLLLGSFASQSESISIHVQRSVQDIFKGSGHYIGNYQNND